MKKTSGSGSPAELSGLVVAVLGCDEDGKPAARGEEDEEEEGYACP